MDAVQRHALVDQSDLGACVAVQERGDAVAAPVPRLADVRDVVLVDSLGQRVDGGEHAAPPAVPAPRVQQRGQRGDPGAATPRAGHAPLADGHATRAATALQAMGEQEVDVLVEVGADERGLGGAHLRTPRRNLVEHRSGRRRGGPSRVLAQEPDEHRVEEAGAIEHPASGAAQRQCAVVDGGLEGVEVRIPTVDHPEDQAFGVHRGDRITSVICRSAGRRAGGRRPRPPAVPHAPRARR